MSDVARTIRASFCCAAVTASILALSYPIMQPPKNLLTTCSYLLALVAAVVLVRTLILYHRIPNPVRVAKLARAVHDTVRELAIRGYTKLCPLYAGTQTAYLRIKVVGSTVYVHRFNWDEYHGTAPSRKFEIRPNGQVTRHSNDEGWLHVSVERQLEKLLKDLRHDYAPRFEERKVRREDH